jgi:hypothetical protein
MLPIYICGWHVLKASWVRALKKIKNVVVCPAILDDLHAILYVMINCGENIKNFKAHGRKKVMANFE